MEATELKERLRRHDISQRQLADAVGIDVTKLNKAIAGTRRFQVSEIDRIRDYLEKVESQGKNSLELRVSLNHAVPAGDYFTMGGTEYAAIQRYDARLSAGHGSIVDPNAEPLGVQLYEAQWLRSVTNAAPSQLAVVRVDGDSMEHTLNDGDWILVDRGQQRLNREGIYALQVGDACWVKRVTLNLRDRLIRVISDNPVYPVQELSEDELSCIGRVVWIVGRAL